MPADPTAHLLALLDLERLDEDTFLGPNGGEGGRRVFGGQVAAQALRAAGATVRAEHRVNSLHAYFLRPGRYGEPITYVVDRIRDGSSFSTRRVVALQGAEAILNLDASFHRDEPGDQYQPPSPVPLAVPPEDAPPLAPPGPPGALPHRRPFLLREASPDAEPDGGHAMWVRATTQLPDDPGLHACVLTFLSDMGPVRAVRRRLGDWSFQAGMSASLDHCLWFHRAARADDWLLYRLDTVAAAGARGVAKGEIWTAGGVLAATVVQEALVRPAPRP